MFRIIATLLFSLFLCLGSSSVIEAVQVTSPFGWRVHPISGQWKFHAGVDLGYDYGDAIAAIYGGKVVYSAEYEGYGNCIIIEDAVHDFELYAHCNSLLAEYGQMVAAGQIIATVGSTGYSTGPHLHLEYWKNGQYVDPLILLGEQ